MNYKEIYFAVFIEILAVTLFLKLEKFFSFFSYIVLHFFSSFLIALALSGMLGMINKFKHLKREIFVVLTFLIFLTSLFGIMFSIFLAFYIQKLKFKKSKEIKSVGLDVNSINLLITKRRFGEGAIYNITKGSPNFKLSVLAYITKNNMPNKGEILKEALSDSNDEVRLMAFSVLSREEDKLNKVIFEKLEELKTAKEKEKIYKDLGKLYWEFIYLGIVDENLKEFYLNLAKENFEKSKNDYESMLYLGRIYLREKNIEKAKEMLEEVAKVDKKAIPYLAEVYFYERNFKKTRELMAQIDLFSINPNFYFNYKVWDET